MRFSICVLAAAAGLLTSVSASAQIVVCPYGGDPIWIADRGTGCKLYACPHPMKLAATWSGACVNGLAEGTGRAEWFAEDKLGNRYEGDMKGGKYEGTGRMVWLREGRPFMWYEGGWKAGARDGRGIFVGPKGSRVDANWRKGIAEGEGVLTSPDGSHYHGQIHRDRPHGHGTLVSKSGEIYEGNWTNGCLKISRRRLVAFFATPAECGGR